jgi:hypothetical protein
METFDNVTTMMDVMAIFPSPFNLVIAGMPIIIAMAWILFIIGIIVGVLSIIARVFNS